MMALVSAVTMSRWTSSLATRRRMDSTETLSGIDSMAAHSFAGTVVNATRGGDEDLSGEDTGPFEKVRVPALLFVRVQVGTPGGICRSGGETCGISAQLDFEDETLLFPGSCGSCGASLRLWQLNCNAASELDETGTSIGSEDVITGSVLDCPRDSQ